MFTFENVAYHHILDVLNMQIKPDGITSLVGASGSGKTTALRLMNKLISPTHGQIYYRGEDLNERDAVEHRRDVMLLSQQAVLYDGTIRDNLQVGFRFQKKDIPKDELLWQALSDVALSVELDASADHLSGGEQQRLALARMMLLDPSTYLLDEPSSALDETTANQIIELVVSRAQEQKKKVILVSHDRQMVDRFSDQIIYIEKGRVRQMT